MSTLCPDKAAATWLEAAFDPGRRPFVVVHPWSFFTQGLGTGFKGQDVIVTVTGVSILAMMTEVDKWDRMRTSSTTEGTQCEQEGGIFEEEDRRHAQAA